MVAFLKRGGVFPSSSAVRKLLACPRRHPTWIESLELFTTTSCGVEKRVQNRPIDIFGDALSDRLASA